MGSATDLIIANLALSQIGSRRITTFGETTTAEGRAINAVYSYLLDEVLMEHPWTFAQKRVALVDMTRSVQDDWVTATVYAVDDIVYDPTLTKYYICLVAHTATTLFATDLASANWELYTSWVTSTVYDKGDNVYNIGIEYACLVNHSSAALFATDLAALKWVATELVTDLDDSLTNIYYLPTDFLKVNQLSDIDSIHSIALNRFLCDTDAISIRYTYRNETETEYTGNFVTAFATRLAAGICFELVQSVSKSEALLAKYEDIDLPRAMSADSQQGAAEELRQDEWLQAREI